MIRFPRSRHGVVIGGLLGLTLGPAGVAAGILCGVLLDSVLFEARIRRAVCTCLMDLQGGERLRGAGRARDWLGSRRDRDLLTHYVGGVEWVRLAAVGVRINCPVGVAGGPEVPPDRIAQVTVYLETVFGLPPHVTARLLPSVQTESLKYSIEQLLESLFACATEGRLNVHMAFLDSLLPPGSPGVRARVGGAAAGVGGVAGRGREQRESADRPGSGEGEYKPHAPADRTAENALLLWDGYASVVLGLNGPASLQEVRAAFRRLAREHHPDQSGSETEAFIRIREAYETLVTRSSVLSEGPGCEDARKDPRSRAQSDTHC